MISKACKYCDTEHPYTNEYWRFLPKGKECRKYHRDYNKQRSQKLRDEQRKLNPPRIPMGKELREKLKLERRKQRMKTDPQYRLQTRLRKRLKKALVAQKTKKNNKFQELLGCSNEQLKVFLESKFQPGMTWDNYGKWHVDHILPLSRVNLTISEELHKVAHYSNLQPLWAKDNLIKSNRWWYQ